MIVKIGKLNMAVLSYDRDALLNELSKTGAVEIKTHSEEEGTFPLADCGDDLRAYLNRLEAALEILVSSAENSADKKSAVKDGFAVSYEEFSSAASLKDRAEALVDKVNALTDKKNAALTEVTRLARAAEAAAPYTQAALAFDEYSDTAHTKVRLGVLSESSFDDLQKQLEEQPLVSYSYEKTEYGMLFLIIYHKSAADKIETLLSSAGFTACPYTGGLNGREQFENLTIQLENAEKEAEAAANAVNGLTDGIRDLKIYCDYIGFQIEKAESSSKFRGTDRTVFIEAYVPEESETAVRTALENLQFPVWYEFSEPAEDEEVPTLLKNNAVVTTFETITNTYSPPNPKEFDPNTVMAFFYSLFLGFIMADIGYGLLMMIGGGILYYKSRAGSGIKNLSGVFAVGGIFTVLWGVLFNSLFGVSVLPFTVMPNAQSDTYTFVGISIPAVLIIAMILGIVQLMAGYILKAVQEWRRGNILDGIFSGLTWAFFSLGAGMAVAGLVEEFNLPQIFVTAGGICAGVSLLTAALTAGRKEKFLGKITKGFGSVYGIINYVSDILSYARLYGLMLSGAIIAQIISQYSIQFITGGNAAFAILGVVLMIVGHAFNLAIGLLGAYIHDARLQYVEFYGKFFEGEGELFTPLGSEHRHIYIEQFHEK